MCGTFLSISKHQFSEICLSTRFLFIKSATYLSSVGHSFDNSISIFIIWSNKMYESLFSYLLKISFVVNIESLSK
jgi:hypothetical protein